MWAERKASYLRILGMQRLFSKKFSFRNDEFSKENHCKVFQILENFRLRRANRKLQQKTLFSKLVGKNFRYVKNQ